MIRVVIIDDEQPSISFLTKLLKEIPSVEVLGGFLNPFEGVYTATNKSVDVIFLDIEMPEISGLEIANQLRTLPKPPIIIFVTAYESHALKAFEFEMIDYLLKPVTRERLLITLGRIQKFLTQEEKLLNQEIAATDMTATQISQLTQLSLATFSKFNLYDHDQNIVRWRTKKTKELFAFLWSRRDESVHRDTILEFVWPDRDYLSHIKILYTSIYYLRATMAKLGFEGVISLINESYILHSSCFDSDYDQVTAIVENSKSSDGSSVSEDEINRLCILYSGKYMEEDSYPWVLAEQANIHTKVTTWLEKQIVKDFLNSCSPKMLELQEIVLKKLIEIEPLEASYIHALMKFYHITGRKRAIEDSYQRYVAALDSDLRQSPDTETLDLYQSLMKIDTY